MSSWLAALCSCTTTGSRGPARPPGGTPWPVAGDAGDNDGSQATTGLRPAGFGAWRLATTLPEMDVRRFGPETDRDGAP